MQPPSFEEFMNKQSAKDAPSAHEVLNLTECPVPGCPGKHLKPGYEKGVLTSFTCENGCKFSAHRNIFTNDIVFYQLDQFVEAHFVRPELIRGLKFNPIGEKYVDWY